jgi:Gpi18-like mannosyltransferase
MRRVVRTALLAFLLTRGLFFALAICGSQMAFERKVYSNTVWETRVVLNTSRLMPELRRVVMSGDAWFYRSIALDGYTRRPASQAAGANWAFFPLYPLAVRFLGVTGDFAADGLLLSNLAFLGALIAVGAASLRSGGTPDDADRAMLYLGCFPTSYFCALPLPESLFLLLSTCAFVAALAKKWPLAGVLGALAAATRLVGLLLLPALLLLAWEQRARIRSALWALIVPLGTAAFMIHLRTLTGSPFAFATVQAQWGRHTSAFWQPLWVAVRTFPEVSQPWNFVAFHFAVALLLIGAGIALLVERRWSFGTYTLGSALVPLCSGTLQSFGRYAVVVFPLFLYLGIKGRNPNVDRIILAASLLLFGWFAAFFVLRVDFALA